jgi:hypothetical protein
LLSEDARRSSGIGSDEATTRSRRQLRALQTAQVCAAATNCIVSPTVPQQASSSNALSKGDSSEDDDGSASMSMSEENRYFLRRLSSLFVLFFSGSYFVCFGSISL